MADVRALLRSERASRRITHPLAIYSKAGALSCRLCREQVKAENLWEQHLRSERHVQHVQEAAKQETGKKRSADSSLDAEMSVRKKVRTPQPDAADGTGSEDMEAGDADSGDTSEPRLEAVTEEQPEAVVEVPRGVVDEDEWAAFEREVLNDAPAASVLVAAPTISAAAISAAELEALQTEPVPENLVKAMEAELSGEKEDASRQMEEEIETMESLETRLKALRERRDAVRATEILAAPIEQEAVADQSDTISGDESDLDEDDDDDWDSWRKRGA